MLIPSSVLVVPEVFSASVNGIGAMWWRIHGQIALAAPSDVPAQPDAVPKR
jgi:hypothetical protein